VSGLPRRFWAHSADEIDFARLKGKRVAVIGVGASAVDNAAEALEHGAAEVRHLIRRKEMPTINKMMGIGSYGFTAGYADLPDAWRWRFMQYSFATQTPPPHGSTLRVSRHPNAYFHFGKETTRTTEERRRPVLIGFADGTALRDGFRDPRHRLHHRSDGPHRVRRRRRRHPALEGRLYAAARRSSPTDLGQFPVSQRRFHLQREDAGPRALAEQRVLLQLRGVRILGKVSGDIPGVSDGAAWLARAIAAKLYVEDVEAHWRNMQDYDKPELTGEEWTPTELEARLEAGRVA
jgi:cation diffusion facilitator CzcD-associated flavoprotein CzcO